MKQPRMGRVNYINCLPVFHALEIGSVPAPAQIVAEHPAVLNAAFQQGKLEVTAISSLAYGKFMDDALVLPELSISSQGPVGSVLLVSRIPIRQLSGCTVSLSPYSATSNALLRILLQRFYRQQPDYTMRPAGSSPDWKHPEAVLTIGDEALRIAHSKAYPYIYDLGEEWLKFTGKPMVFALWVANRDFAANYPQQLSEMWASLQASKSWGLKHPGTITAAGVKILDFEPEYLENYFSLLNYDLNWTHIEGLLTFYRLAYAEGLLPRPVILDVWSGENEGNYRLQCAGK